MIKIIAHSGADNTNGDSRSYLSYLNKLKIDGFEIDIRLFDGNVVLSHDPINSNSCLILEEIFDFINEKKKFLVNCDIKEKQATKEVYKKFQEKNMLDKLIFTGNVDFDFIKDKKEIKTFVNSEFLIDGSNIDGFFKDNKIYELIKKYRELEKDYNVSGICINYKSLDILSFKLLLNSGINLSIWTVDNKECLGKMLKIKTNSIIFITTNKINYVLERVNMSNI